MVLVSFYELEHEYNECQGRILIDCKASYLLIVLVKNPFFSTS